MSALRLPRWACDVLNNQALALRRRHPRQAAAIWRALTRQFPAYPLAWYNLADAELRLGRTRSALALFRKARSKYRSQPRARRADLLVGLARAQHRAGRLGEALASLRQARELDRSEIHSRILPAFWLSDAGRPLEAHRLARLALRRRFTLSRSERRRLERISDPARPAAR